MRDENADAENSINLDDERSESSKSSAAIGGALAAGTNTSVDEEEEDDDTDEALEGPLSVGGPKGAGVMKRAWQPEEDTRLLQLVTELGPCHWSVIASYLEGRVGKQCRER